MKFLCFFGPACTALAVTLSTPAVAQNSAMEPVMDPLTPTTALHRAGHTGFNQAVPAATLGDYRGGSGMVYNDMKLAGTTAGNTAMDVTTGTNTISAGAFSNMSGLPLVVQNSGANVLIQNAVILNLQMN